MYENILLESGKVFRGSVSGVGGKVVDDSETITITAVGFGMADIITVNAPEFFVPGEPFFINVTIMNVGSFDDVLFIRLTDVDTGTILGESEISVPAGERAPYVPLGVTLTQTTDFHGLVEVGHSED